MKKEMILLLLVLPFITKTGDFAHVLKHVEGFIDQHVQQSSSSAGVGFSARLDFTISVNMRNVAIANQSIPNGLSPHDELHHEFCTMQLSGKIVTLQKRLVALYEKIKKHSFLPMRSEHKQLNTIRHLLEKPVMQLMKTIQQGSLSQAHQALGKLCKEYTHEEALRGMGHKSFAYTYSQLCEARELMLARPDYQRSVLRSVGQSPAPAVPKPASEPSVPKPASEAVTPSTSLTLKPEIGSLNHNQQDLSVNIQPQIINALETSPNHDVLIDKLRLTTNAVYSNADKYHYVINSDVDHRIQAAINGLPLTEDPREFAFHMATLDHLLNDIQLQTAQGVNVTISIADRSPELLARAIAKYVEYLAPTQNEIACIIDLAKYISDATTGSTYLAPAVRELRMGQFWERMSSLSEITAEEVVDSCAYLAARASWAFGLPRVIGVLKNIRDVASAGAATAATGFAQRFAYIFDHVISHNPAIITSDGNVIIHASQQMAEESCQLIQAFDGMKDKVNGKVPTEILDDSQKLIQKESEIESAEKISIGSDKPHTFTNQEIEEAMEHVFNDPNKIHHIFQKKHKLELLPEELTQEKIVRIVLNQLNGKVPFNGQIKDFIVKIAGQEVNVRCRIMDGIIKLSSVFIR